MILLLICIFYKVYSNFYYISKDGNDNNVGSSTHPWKTITKSNTVLSSGDTVFIKSGEYEEVIKPVNSGLKDNYITYTNFENDIVIITNSPGKIGMVLNGISYIKIDGINFNGKNYYLDSNLDRWVDLISSSYNIFENSNFKFAGGNAGFHLSNNCMYNKFINNTFDFCGAYVRDTGDDFGQHFWIRPGCGYNLFENNIFTHGGHNLMMIESSFNVIRNNLFDNSWEDFIGPNKGNRLWSLKTESTYNLVEKNMMRNVFPAGDTDNPKGFKIIGVNHIFRKNVFYNICQDGITAVAGPSGNKVIGSNIYNNVIVKTGNAPYKDSHDADLLFAIQTNSNPSGDPINECVVKGNSLVSQIAEDALINVYGIGKKSVSWWESNYPDFTSDNVEIIPEFVSSSFSERKDFILKENSLLINAGVFLTNAINDGDGVSVEVENAGYFSDGFGIIESDTIQIGNNSPVKITSIDYGANIIEIQTSINWKKGDGVSLPYVGSAPDIGAFEFGLIEIDDDDDDDDDDDAFKNTILIGVIVGSTVLLLLIIVILSLLVLVVVKRKRNFLKLKDTITNASSCLEDVAKSEIDGSSVLMESKMEEEVKSSM